MLRQENKLILKALINNARSSNSFITKIAGLNPSTVQRRITKLERDGIIKGYPTIVFASAVGITKYQEVYIDAKLDHEIIQKICSIPQVIRVTRYSGQWKLGLTLACFTLMQNDEVLKEIKKIIGNNLNSLEVLSYCKASLVGRNYFSDVVVDYKDTSKKCYYEEFNSACPKPRGIQNLDDVDLDILEALRMDSRISISDIEKKIGKSRKLIDLRIRDLIKRGIISKFTIGVDKTKLGFDKLNLFFKLESNCDRENVVNQLKSLKGAHYYGEFLQGWDVMVTVLTSSVSKTINEIEKIKEEGGIFKDILLHEVKEYKQIAFPEDLKKSYKHAISVFRGEPIEVKVR